MLYQLSYASAQKGTLMVTQAILSQQDSRTSGETGVNARPGSGPAQRSSVPELFPQYRNPTRMTSMAGWWRGVLAGRGGDRRSCRFLAAKRRPCQWANVLLIWQQAPSRAGAFPRPGGFSVIGGKGRRSGKAPALRYGLLVAALLCGAGLRPSLGRSVARRSPLRGEGPARVPVLTFFLTYPARGAMLKYQKRSRFRRG